jgi:AbiV family abortive infection protein
LTPWFLSKKLNPDNSRYRTGVVLSKNFNKRKRVIAREKMPEGIDLCKANITQFLKDSRLLIDNSTLSHAYISVQYAIEELGKILIFRDKLTIDKSDPLTITYEEAFKSHYGKTEKALHFLGKGYDRVFDGGVWEKGIWEKGVWTEDTYVEHETRLDCAFVDYYALRWQIGRDINKELLAKLINRIEEKLHEI